MTSLTTGSLEDALLINEWGRWAWEGNGTVYSGWVNKMKNGYREMPKNYMAPIDDEYGYQLDALIARLDKLSKCVIIELYINRCSINRLQSIVGLNRHEIRQVRDIALGVVYGMLKVAA